MTGDPRQALAEFLRIGRTRVRPQDVGLTALLELLRRETWYRSVSLAPAS
ncbi:hypothetical protein [Nocardia alni]|nr:hypothetical protein [Nocardia alni]